jgi:CheY-like chemotaxis protein
VPGPCRAAPVVGSETLGPQIPTLLVVDDDDDVRDLAVSIFEDEGYQVIAAPNALKALEILEANPGIRLLFTDVVMPGMDGFLLAQEARKLRPDLRVLYTSGYLKNAPAGERGIGFGPLVSKPWNTRTLKQMIRQAWD